MSAAIHAFDGRQAVLVEAHEIEIGDAMRDCGRLRVVEAVDLAPIAESLLIRFADDADGLYSTLSVPARGVTVTVWRLLGEAAGIRRAAA